MKCKHCGEEIEFTRGRAFTGWVHRTGSMICDAHKTTWRHGLSVAEPTAPVVAPIGSVPA